MVDVVRSLHAVPDPGFGQRLRAARLARGLTQAQLGSMLGARQQTVGAWERGEKPQKRFFEGLSQFLDLGSTNELAAMLDDLDGSAAAGGPRTSSTSSPEPNAPTNIDALKGLANAVGVRLTEGPPFSSDEAAMIRDLIIALRTSAG